MDKLVWRELSKDESEWYPHDDMIKAIRVGLALNPEGDEKIVYVTTDDDVSIYGRIELVWLEASNYYSDKAGCHTETLRAALIKIDGGEEVKAAYLATQGTGGTFIAFYIRG